MPLNSMVIVSLPHPWGMARNTLQLRRGMSVDFLPGRTSSSVCEFFPEEYPLNVDFLPGRTSSPAGSKGKCN